jgi:hypothetical protein
MRRGSGIVHERMAGLSFRVRIVVGAAAGEYLRENPGADPDEAMELALDVHAPETKVMVKTEEKPR